MINNNILVKYKKDKDTYWGEKHGEYVYRINGSVYSNYTVGECDGLYNDLVKLPPCDATKIVAVALNFKGVAEVECDNYEPLIFLKGLNTLIYNDEPVYCPTDRDAWLEVELGLVIKKKCYNVKENIQDYILGYTLGNDITATNCFGRDHHLAISKSMDSFCPVGPYLIDGIDPFNITLVSRINGNIIQYSSIKDLIVNVYECVSYISKFMTLEPGDLILTGTPIGTGPKSRGLIKPGDTIEVEIANVLKLANPVLSLTDKK